MYSPARIEIRCALPPSAGARQRCPPSAQSKVTKATEDPSGDQAGAYSKPAAKPPDVRRRGSPPAASCNQILPTLSKAMRLPSGDAVGQRGKRASKDSSGIARSP